MPVKKTSLKAVNDFEDESLDFVYIDALHDYESVKQDIEIWSKKVRKGGIVSGHDYYEHKQTEVVRAVDEYVEEHNVEQLVLANEGRVHKKNTWFWVK